MLDGKLSDALLVLVVIRQRFALPTTQFSINLWGRYPSAGRSKRWMKKDKARSMNSRTLVRQCTKGRIMQKAEEGPTITPYELINQKLLNSLDSIFLIPFVRFYYYFKFVRASLNGKSHEASGCCLHHVSILLFGKVFGVGVQGNYILLGAS